MNKIHIAIGTQSIEQSIVDYTQRLGLKPCCVVAGEYALWRTAILNLALRQDDSCPPGSVRHLGWEDSAASEFSQEIDINGLVWERFSAEQQAQEINALWPQAGYCPNLSINCP